MRTTPALALVLGIAIGAAAVSTFPEAGAKDDPRVPAVTAQVRAAFSPGGDIEPMLLEAIKNAKAEIVVAMFHFTSRPLAEALGRAKARGVDVRVILDRSQAFQKHGKVHDLRRSKVNLRVMSLGKTGDDSQIRFHHKFMVIDREVVTTGSFNWTSQAADENYENELVVASKPLAAQFREVFEKCWEKAEDDSVKKATADGADTDESSD